jgi:hypothetical protein
MSSFNPYQSPAVGPVGQPGAWAGPPLVYRPANGLVFMVTLSLATLLLLCTLVFVIDVISELAFPGLLAKENPTSAEAVPMMVLGGSLALAGLATMAMHILTVVLFCMTVFRFNKNARALGSQGLEYTPGWSVGWFFIPIANLFKPFQAVSEIYKASDPKAGAFDWRQSPTDTALGWWWGTWIIGNIISQVEIRMQFRQIEVPPEVSLSVSGISLVFTIAAGILAIYVVRSIHARLEAKAGLATAKPPVVPHGYGDVYR